VVRVSGGLYQSNVSATSSLLVDGRGLDFAPSINPKIRAALGPTGSVTIDPDTGTVDSPPWPGPENGSVQDVLRREDDYPTSGDILAVEVTMGGFPIVLCDDSKSGLYGKYSSAISAWTKGGLFRCTQAIAQGDDGSVYVTDVALPFPGGGDARVVKVGPPGTWNTQSLVGSIPDSQFGALTLPMGITVVPATYVPEPDAALLDAVACATFLSLAAGWRRRRLRSSHAIGVLATGFASSRR
jgi:hypothetical protein